MALLQSLAAAGIRLIGAHPRLYRLAQMVAYRVPGFRARVHRLLGPALPPTAGEDDSTSRYLFTVGEAVADAGGIVTVEQLYHLSRSI